MIPLKIAQFQYKNDLYNTNCINDLQCEQGRNNKTLPKGNYSQNFIFTGPETSVSFNILLFKEQARMLVY